MERNRPIDYLSIADQAISLCDGFQASNVLVYDRPEFSSQVQDGLLNVSQKFGFQSWQNEINRQPTISQDPIWLDSNHPLYILYTSGTTGNPKGVVRPSAGYAVALSWSFDNLFGVDYKSQNQRWFCAADVGWIVGHSYTVYGPLINGNTTLIFEGKPVNAELDLPHSPFFKQIADHHITQSFVSPTAMRAVRNFAAKQGDENCDQVRKFFDISKFENMYIAGEHCEVDTLNWTTQAFDCETYDNWWQTEVGWPITCPFVKLSNQAGVKFPQPKGSTGLPVPGWNVQMDQEIGRILVKLPMPPGAMNGLWQGDQRYKDTYFTSFDGFYDSMDSGEMDGNNFVTVFSRVDDVINVAGHRISTGQLEEALCNDKNIAEAAVVGQKDKIKGQIPVAFIITNCDPAENSEVIQKAIDRVSQQIGRFSKVEKFYSVTRLPKTRSGKTPRKTLAQLVNGEEIQIPSTIEDASGGMSSAILVKSQKVPNFFLLLANFDLENCLLSPSSKFVLIYRYLVCLLLKAIKINDFALFNNFYLCGTKAPKSALKAP